METVHRPVLLEPVVQALIQPFLSLPKDAPPHWLVDCTLGGGGHCAAFLKAFDERPELQKHRILAMDQDAGAIERASVTFEAALQQGMLTLVKSRFGDSTDFIRNRPVLGLMADLGFSSDQMDDPRRGLSFMASGPLDMRLDRSQGETCREILNQATESEIEHWLREWGEERFSRRIASAIIARRQMGQLPSTTQELAEVVVRAIPYSARHGRIHVATRTFQALRIVVNKELNELEKLLNDVVPSVLPGGRVAIISFHSLEDRQVKWKFKKSEMFTPLTKKPIVASEEEIHENPRARSAKLRIVEKKC